MLHEALKRMPHAGRMRLIGEILAADDARIEALATDHSSISYPLRIGGVLYPAVLIELGAQAAAAHSSIHGVRAAHVGLVVAVSHVEIARDEVTGNSPLQVRADMLQMVGDAARYWFQVADGAGPLVRGEVLLQMQKRRD